MLQHYKYLDRSKNFLNKLYVLLYQTACSKIVPLLLAAKDKSLGID